MTKAVADFDGDKNVEIVTIAANTAYVFENIADNMYELTQTWDLPPASIDALEELNLDGGLPEFAVGLQIGFSPTQFEWRIYKEDEDNNFEEWYRSSFPQNIWITRPKQTKGDYDNDGLDEILADDHPTLRILEFVDGQVQETWTSPQPNPHYLTSADLRMDGVMNFVVVNFISGSHVMSFWEEERLANAYVNKSLDASSTWPNSARHLLKGGGKLHGQFTSGGDIFYRRSGDNGITWEMTKRISSGEGAYSSGCLAVAHANSLHLVWQRQIASDRFQVWYSRSLDNGTSWSAPIILPNANNVRVGYWQAGGAMPVIAEMSTSMSTDGGES